jgi:hypothetical protein
VSLAGPNGQHVLVKLLVAHLLLTPDNTENVDSNFNRLADSRHGFREAVIDAFVELCENPNDKLHEIRIGNDRPLMAWLYR